MSQTAGERVYADKDWLENQYWKNGLSISEMAKKADVSMSTIHHHMEENGIGRRPANDDVEYDDETIRKLYWDEGMSTNEIGDKLGVWGASIQKRMQRNGIKRRPADRDQLHAGFATPPTGYEWWKTKVGGEFKHVLVHRLLAVSEYGFERLDGMHVHHKNDIPWDNRIENLELMTPEEHAKHHDNLGVNK